VATKFGVMKGLSIGLLWAVMFSDYALGSWYGSRLIGEKDPDYSAGTFMIIFFSLITGAFTLAGLTPIVKAFAEAHQAL